MNFCFLVINGISSFFLDVSCFRKLKKNWKCLFHYILEAKVIKGHLIQYSDLFILKLNVLFLYYFECLQILVFLLRYRNI